MPLLSMDPVGLCMGALGLAARLLLVLPFALPSEGIAQVQLPYTTSPTGALVISQQPIATAALVGSPAGFGVVASGSSAISYQWRKNGVNIAGATSATYNISSVTLEDAGLYSVVLSNSSTSVTSASVELSVGKYVWTTYAGTMGVEGSSDGVPGKFMNPTGLFLGAQGTLVVGDSFNRTVRGVAQNGSVNTIAGIVGVNGSTDAQGALATFGLTQDVTMDAVGNIYVADTSNNIIRKITSSGSVSTLAGMANMWGPLDGQGSAARFNNPWSLTVDGNGNVYVADGDNHAIRKISPTGAVTTLAGSLGFPGSSDGTGNAARFDTPYGITADKIGNLYVADGNNHTIRKITSDGKVTTLAGSAGNQGRADGIGAAAQFSYPSDLSVDAGGNLYVADSENGTIRKVSPGGAVSTIGGLAGEVGMSNGAGSDARFDGPSDVAVDSVGQLYIADRGNRVIRKGIFNTLPGITTPPASLTKATGAQVQLKVIAKGTAPLSYQWRKAGVNMLGATSDTFTISTAVESDSGSYDVVVTNPAGSATSAAAEVRVLIPAAITVQPASATIGSGANVTLSVTATGSSLAYQWRKNGVAISGATNPTFGIGFAQVANSGGYDVVVSNAVGSVTSNVATLNVLASVAFVKPPTSVAVNPGGSTTLTATVSGALPITYQWRKGGAAIAGATGASYTIAAATAASAGVYDVVATNSVSSATSQTATVSVNTPVSIAIQPVSKTVNPGASISLSVVATGTAPLTYQWRRNGVAIAGGTSATYSGVVQSAQAGNYDVVVSNPVGSVTSAVAAVALNVAPTITAQPVAGAVNPGASKTLMVGVSGTAPFTYQWRKDGVPLSGGTGSSYTIAPIQTANAGTYSVVVSNEVGSVTSTNAVLVLNVPVQITAQPVGGELVPGASKLLSATATGTAPLTYQWRKDGVAIAGATGTTYTISNAQAASAGAYDVLVSNVVGSVASQPAVFKMAAPVVINTQPAGGNVLLGGSFKFSVTASGSGPLSYIWRKDGVRLTAGSYQFIPGWRNWREAKADAEKRGGHLGTVTSAAEWEEVSRQLGGNKSQRMWIGGYRVAPFTAGWKWVTGEPMTYTHWSSGEPSGDDPDADGLGCIVLKYSPYWNDGASSHDNAGYLLETENGGATFEITNATALSAGSYEVIVFNPVGGVTSQTVKLTTVDPLKIVANPFSTVTNPGSPVAFSVIATGTGPLTYQWRKNGVNIVGATSDTLRISSVQLSDAASYDAVVSGASGSLTTTAATLSVNDLVITQQPVGGAVVVGGSYTFNVKATGTNPIIYKWRKNGVPIGNSVYAYVDGKMSWVQAKADAEAKGGHLVTISSAEEWAEIAKQLGANASKFAWIGGFQPSGSVEPKGGWSWVTGEPFTYTNWNTNEPNNMVYGGAPENWLQVNFPEHRAFSWNDLWNAPDTIGKPEYVPLGYIMETEGLGASFTLTNVQQTDAGTYDVVLYNPTGTVSSGSVNLVVQTGVVLTQQPVGRTVNPGTLVAFSVAATGTEPFTYQWRKNGTPVAGGTGKTLSIPSVVPSDAGIYSVTVSNVVGSVSSQEAALSLNTPVTIVSQPRGMAVNPGQPFSLSVTPSGTAPFSYQWRLGGVPIAGATTGILSIPAAQTINAGSYDVVVKNIVNSVTSTAAVVTLNAPVLFTSQPTDQTVNPGGSASFSVAVTGTAPFTYQWRKNGVPLAGGTAATLALSNVQNGDAGVYDVLVNNVAGSQVSKGARLMLNVAPTIVTQPANVLINPGAPFSLRVDATGTAPLAYQWRKNGVSITGGTAAVYSVTSGGTLSAGSYDVVVSNMVASVTSNPAVVAYNVPVTISAQPVSVTLNPGAPLNLSVTASGTGPISYQWRFNGKAITGATASTFSVSAVNASNEGSYDVVLSNVVGSVLSTVANVKVNAPVLITTQPVSAAINPGAAKTLSVTATGTAPLTYQWRKNGVAVNAGTASTFAISTTLGEQEGSYDVVVSNVVGSVTSNTAVLSLNTPITILTQPKSVMGNVGTPVQLTVSASGTAPITYQWRRNGANILGAIAASYSPTGGLTTSTVGSYDVVVSNVVGSGTSAAAILTLNSPVKIETQPVGLTVNYGASATLSVVASGTAPLTYQWRKNNVNIPGATQADYNVPSAQMANAGAYSVVVTNPVGSVTSLTASLSVNAAENTKKFVYVPGGFTWAEAKLNAETRGGHLVTITSAAKWTDIEAQLGVSTHYCLWIGAYQPDGSAEPGGGWRWVTGEPFVYQHWDSGEPNNRGNENCAHINWGNYSTWNDKSGGDRYGYILEIEPIVMTTQPASLSVNEGSPASFSVTAGGSPPLSYQWRKNGVAIVGAKSATLSIAATTAADAAGYDVQITNAAGTVTSAIATLTVVSPLVITKQPSSLVLNPGMDATFSVSSTGSSPITYQWRKAGVPIAGATSDTLTLGSAQASAAGSYDVVLSNPRGSMNSSVASLSFNDPVVVVTHPQGAVLNPGGSVTLSVGVSGTGPFSYQWRKDGRIIEKATASTYVLSGVLANSAGLYDVVVTGIVNTVSSNPALIEVNLPVSITASPTALAVNPGAPATFSVTASGTPALAYQWRKNGATIPGATFSTYTIPAAALSHVGNYDVVVSNVVGSVTSASAALAVNTPLSVTLQPVGAALNPGAAYTLKVAATGTAPISYQWLRNGEPIDGATFATYTIAACTEADAGEYAVTLTNVVGSISSQTAKVTRNVPVSILVQPEGLVLNPPTQAVVSKGGSAPTAASPGTQGVLSVTAIGTGTLTYQWRKNGVPLAGATASSLTVLPVLPTGEGVYDVVVTNVVGSVTSTPTTVRLNVPLSIVSPPLSQVANPGTQVSFAVTAGGTVPITYQWKKNGVVIEGAVLDTYTIAAAQLSDVGQYEVVVSNVVGSTTSAPAALVLNAPVTFPTQPASAQVNLGAQAVLSARVEGTAPIVLQWRKDGVDIPGANTAVYSVPAVSLLDAGSYELLATNVVGSVTSDTAVLSVNEPVTVTAQPASLAVNPGAAANLAVSVAGTAPFSYQWFRNGLAVAGGTSASLSIGAAQVGDAGEYKVSISNKVGTVSSSPAVLSINEAVSFSSQPVGSTVLTGTPAKLSVSVAGTAPFSYQWSKNGVVLPGATGATYELASAAESDTGSYTVEVTNVVGSRVSAAGVLTVNTPLSISTQPASLTVTAGSSATLAVVATGTAPISYQWRKGGAVLAGATQASLAIGAVTDSDSGSYDVVLTNPAGSITSEAAVLTVNRPVNLLTQPAAATVVAGGTLLLSVSASGTEPFTYQWRKDGAAIAGATSAKLEVSPVQVTDAGSYEVVVSNVVGPVTSTAAAVTVLTPVKITAQPTSLTVTAGSLATFTVTAEGTGPIGYQWFKDGTAVAGAISASHTIATAQAQDEGSYTVAVSNSTGPVNSLAATLTVLQPVTIVSQPLNVTAIAGGSAAFSVGATGTGPLSYQWRKNGAVIVGGSSDSLLLNPVAGLDVGSYDVVVTNVTGSVTSNSGSLVVLEPPTIQTQPAGSTVELGQPIALSVVAVGGGTLSYQWSKNGTNILGATAPALSIESAQATDAGTYSVAVSGVAGSVNSAAAVVQVNKPQTPQPVSIEVQPKRTAGELDKPSTLSVTALGTQPISYQWYKNGTAIPGGTSSSYLIPAANKDDQGVYWVKVSNSVKVNGQDSMVTSNKVLFAIIGAPSVTQDPVSLSGIQAGAQVQFSATVRCALPFSYLWYRDGVALGAAVDHEAFPKNADGVEEGVITLPLTASTSTKGTYELRVSNACGSDSSAPSILSVLVRSTRLIKQGWNYEFTPTDLVSYTTINKYKKVFGSAASPAADLYPDDTLIVTVGAKDEYRYEWYYNWTTPKPFYSSTSDTLMLSNINLSSYLGALCLKLIKGSVEYRIEFWFKPKKIVTVSSPPAFAFDLQTEYFAKENAPWDFGVTLNKSGAYTYNWYKDGVFLASNNTGFYTVPSSEMSQNASGIYPAEGTYWVEVLDATGTKVLTSKTANLYVFSD